MLVSELLYENILVEKLGNLSQLKVGSMINIVKQSGNMGSGSGRRSSGPHTSPIANKFGAGHTRSDIGANSQIIDVGVLKDGIKSLRQAFKKHETAKAFALYVGGKAVAFGTFDAHDLGGQARGGVFAYDLTPLEGEVKAHHAAKVADHVSNKRWGQEPKQRAMTSFSRQMPSGVVEYNKHTDKDEFIKDLLKLVKGEK